jgi:putative FmdB family regulatory protein
MPIYEYCCDGCGERFELFVRSAGPQSAATCPKCGGQRVRKAISLFGVGGKGESSRASAAPSCGPGPT